MYRYSKTWSIGVVYWRGLLAWSIGVVYWRGLLAWSIGVVYWRGLLAWSIGVATRFRFKGVFSVCWWCFGLVAIKMHFVLVGFSAV